MIYPQLLKTDFRKLPSVLREFHSAAGERIRFEPPRVASCSNSSPLRMNAWARGAGSSWEVEVTIQHVGSYRGTVTPA